MYKLIILLLSFISYSTVSVSAMVTPQQAAIASAHPMATQAGFEVLEKGGNAFDAAIAVSATLAVVEPFSSGLGGGGFWLVQKAGSDKAVMIDGREKAPLSATRTMYQDKNGDIIPGLSVNGALAAGIPGEPAALVYLAKHYGQLSLKESLAPAIQAARQGFKVGHRYQKMASFRRDVLRESAVATRIFLKNNDVPPLGYVVRQPDLARTLELLAEKGQAGFYQGEVASKLVKGTAKAGGIWQMQDLADYQVVIREPVVGKYKGYRITSAAPPSSGGVALLTMLNILSDYKLSALSPLMRTHVTVEAMRRAYADRAFYLGDADFVKVPVKKLISHSHANELQKSINLQQATPSNELGSVTDTSGGNHTTHFSILDKQGNRVAATLSINYPFGSCFMPEGTGVLLNDEMDDFSAKPGVPNAYGLVGAEANAIAPGKRMLSSMSPSFMESGDKLAILGTPGGSRIISMVLHSMLAVAENKTATQVVSQRRFHHQFIPDAIQFEPGAFDENMQTELEFLGHHLKLLGGSYGNMQDGSYGDMQIVIWDKQNQKLEAASDPRGEGLAIVR